MAELKRVFSKAIMNKDMDERLVPNGQYRDANNIEIATSEGSEVGTVQTLFGNTEKNLVLQNSSSLENVLDWTTTEATIGGSAYNMMGPHTKASVVGTVANANTDKIYYLVSGADFSDSSILTNYFGSTSNLGVTNNVAKDYILEYDTINEVHRYVFVDIFKVRTDVDSSVSAADYASGSTTFHISAQAGEAGVPPGIRTGMLISAVDLTLPVGQQQVVSSSDELEVTNVSYNTSPADGTGNPINQWQITTNKPHGLTDNLVVTFDAERVLKFDKENLITGINILDDFLFWTDNHTEPKKIHIKRSIAGTGGSAEIDADNYEQIFFGDNDYFHTRLVKDKTLVTDPNDANTRYKIATNSTNTYPVYTTEEHVTVIRKAPTQPLELEMYRTGAKRVTDEGVENSTTGIIPPNETLNTAIGTAGGANFGNLAVTGQISTGVFFAEPIHLEENDIVLISDEEILLNAANEAESYLIRARVAGSPITTPNNITNGPFALEILSIDPTTPVASFDEDDTTGQPFDFEEPGYGPWFVRLEDKKPMFENRFPRFSYRYKYQDGEYSAFAPFSQIAFLPDEYEYFPKKGYNLGMVNQLRSLKLRYYHHDEDIMPQDVVEIDILYKEAGKPNVYTVKTLKNDVNGDGIVWPDNLVNQSHRGTFTIETDLIHAVLPANQILRPYDNVPRKALAQEISANRLVYGNYLQNFHITKDPIIRVGYESTELGDSYYFPDEDGAYPSVKTMRKYQVGVVFSDGYGRETPVLTHESATVTVKKDNSDTRNRLTCQLDPKFITYPIDDWAEYMSWYVKETSVEYYTMAMDRWYNAADGNVWLSFPSSDRNKLDNETFIVLKKAHGTDEAVKEKARYRILAIESEAPDFIKTQKKSLGRIYNGPASTGIIGAGGVGFPFQDTNYVLIDNSDNDFEDTFGDQLHILTPDTLYLRFYAQGQRSNEYEISRVVKSGNTYRLSLVTKIEEDAAFLSTNDTFEGAVDDMSMEIIEHEVENKPEFDGKFFVKIFKDSVLEEYVLAPVTQEYTVTNSAQIGYIDNNAFTARFDSTGVINIQDNNIMQGQIAFADQIFGNRSAQPDGTVDTSVNTSTQQNAYNLATGIRYVAGTPWHPTEHWHHTAAIANGGQGGTLYDWNPPAGPDAGQLDKNPYIAVNDNVDSSEAARRFWRDHVMPTRTFFIDACTAYTYCTGDITPFPYPGISGSYGSNPGIFDDGENSSVDFPFSNFTGALGPVPADGGGEGYPGNLDHAASTVDNFGQPSRGIWHHPDYPDISFIDISWSGMGAGSNHPNILGSEDANNSQFNDVTENGQGIVHQLQDIFFYGGTASEELNSMSEEAAEADNAQFEAAASFISDLVQLGTLFRFNNDPDNVVYEVVDVPFPVICDDLSSPAQGYNHTVAFHNGTDALSGVWGIRNYRPSNSTGGTAQARMYETGNLRQRWTIAVRATDQYGGGRIGSYNAKYSPTTGTGGYILQNGQIVEDPDYDGAHGVLDSSNELTQRALHHDLTSFDLIQILSPFTDTSESGAFTDKPGIWETEPKESVDIDIYYQASGLMPLKLNNSTNEEYLPIQQDGYGGTKFRIFDTNGNENIHTVTGFDNRTITFTPALTLAEALSINNNDTIIFTKRDSYSVTGHVDGVENINAGGSTITLHSDDSTSGISSHHMANQKHWLDWNNCWCFGNGVESDRIRDDFNAAQVDNGVKASTVLAEQIKEERRKHGLIWSGIYNSNAGVNDLNQFIAAEKITKDINPVYGSIQRILNRDTRLLMFCEDKILRAVTNKDALYNADGNPQLISSNTVIGDTTPYLGDYGIATNPESLAVTPNNVYFSDVVRGKVLALGNQGDGIRVISDNGMKDYFGDTFASNVWRSLGTYDERKKEYNLSIYKKYSSSFPSAYEKITISYSELSKGWISFKSFYPQQGVSLNNHYYTFSDGSLYQHHTNATRNNFYGVQGTSDVTVLFNDQPNLVKSFMALNYEGSEAKIPNFDTESTSQWLTGDYSTGNGLSTENVTDGQYHNLRPTINGWYASEITTNLQECTNTYFIDKEGKYYGYPAGATTTHGSHCDMTSSNIDEKESSVQGIGLANITHGDPTQGNIVCLTIANNVTASYVGDDSAGDAWDTAADIAEDAQRWTCTSQTIEVEGGATIGTNTAGSSPYNVNLVVSPFDANGNATGALLSAANFSIGPESSWDTTQISNSLYMNAGFALNVDPDDDGHIASVIITDTGTPGTPENTVNFAIQFGSSDTWPTADDTWYIDIDETLPEVEDEPSNVGQNKVCFHVRYPRILAPITLPPKIYDITHVSSLDGNDYVIYNEDIDITETDISQPQPITLPPTASEETISYPGDPTTYQAPWTDANVPITYQHVTGITDRVMHDGFCAENQSNLVAQYDFECLPHVSTIPNVDNLGHYFFATENNVSSIQAPVIQAGEYTPYYETQIYYGDTSDSEWWYNADEAPINLNYSGFVLKKFRLKVFYTPPPPGATSTPVGGMNMCDINPGPHLVDVRFNCNGYTSWSTEADVRSMDLVDVRYDTNIDHSQRETYVRVIGTPGTSFNMELTKATSATDYTPTSYFNAETGSFETTATKINGVIPASGKYVLGVSIVPAASKCYYNIVVEPGLRADETKPARYTSRIPTSYGQATMTHHQVKTTTLRPVTSTSSNFGTIPTQTITAPPMFEGKRKRYRGSVINHRIKGGNNSKSSNKITINKFDPNLKIGDILLTLYADNNIPHNTTVTAIEENLITLSNAVSIPNDTSLHFLTKGSRTVPFSLSVPVKNRFTINSGVNYRDQIVGYGSQRRTVQSAVTNGKIIQLNEGSDGLAVGMAITGSELVNTPGYDYLRVETVDIANRQVTVDVNQNIALDATLIFNYPESQDGYSEFDEYNGNHSMSLVHMRVGSSDGNLTLEGYLDVNYLGKDSTNIDILIDNLITIS